MTVTFQEAITHFNEGNRIELITKDGDVWAFEGREDANNLIGNLTLEEMVNGTWVKK